MYEWLAVSMVSVCMLIRESSTESDDTHPVVATARGVYDSKGGVLESEETGMNIYIFIHICIFAYCTLYSTFESFLIQ